MWNPQELNRAYYDLSQSVKDKPITILYGGRNSSKSHSVMQWLSLRLWNEDANAVWYRKNSLVLEKKAYQPMVDVLASKGLKEHVTCTFYTLKREITFPQGNKLIYDHCQNAAMSKGMANVRYVIIDEIDQLTLEDFMGIVTSYRGDDKIRFIFMFNPVSERHWLKKVFFDNKADGEAGMFKKMTNAFKYTIEDNKFATAMDYDILDALQESDTNQYRIQRLGEWGTVNIEDPFIDGFDYNTNVVEAEIPFFRNYPLILSFDFGKTENCVVGQHFNDYDIQSDESLMRYFKHHDRGAVTRIANYRVGGSQSNIDVIIQKIVDRFGVDNEFHIMGDTSGGSDPYSRFVEIRRILEDKGAGFLHFPKRVKPTHIANRAVTNWSMRHYGTNYQIAHECGTLIDDIMQVRVDELGKIDKADCIRMDKGHLLDCMRYMDFIYEVRNFYLSNTYFVENTLRGAITTHV